MVSRKRKREKRGKEKKENPSSALADEARASDALACAATLQWKVN